MYTVLIFLPSESSHFSVTGKFDFRFGELMYYNPVREYAEHLYKISHSSADHPAGQAAALPAVPSVH